MKFASSLQHEIVILLTSFWEMAARSAYFIMVSIGVNFTTNIIIFAANRHITQDEGGLIIASDVIIYKYRRYMALWEEGRR